jgi:hypothetical protein
MTESARRRDAGREQRTRSSEPLFWLALTVGVLLLFAAPLLVWGLVGLGVQGAMTMNSDQDGTWAESVCGHLRRVDDSTASFVVVTRERDVSQPPIWRRQIAESAMVVRQDLADLRLTMAAPPHESTGIGATLLHEFEPIGARVFNTVAVVDELAGRSDASTEEYTTATAALEQAQADLRGFENGSARQLCGVP